eukprot:m.43865 g.43865  ORF g.43865 m.43865 type:complete len:322 (+) comp12063_c0_seq1:281-1246(+)
MATNPLLVKAPLGKPKMNTRDPNMVYGMQTRRDEGGTAAILSNRMSTPLESEAAARAKERNPLLFKAEVGHSRKPLTKGVEDMVHGSKSVKKSDVKSAICEWQVSETQSTKWNEPEVGRARPPMSASTVNKVHGLKSVRKDGGAAEVLSSWVAPDTPTRTHTSPLLAKADVGAAKHILDASILEKVHGKKSKNPTEEGGVIGALRNWDRPDTRDANERFKTSSRLYKAELGRAKPAWIHETEEAVHGKKNKMKANGAQEALSNWNPGTPQVRARHHVEVPKDMVFGKPNTKEDGLSALISHSYGKQWLQEQLAKQTQHEQL